MINFVLVHLVLTFNTLSKYTTTTKNSFYDAMEFNTWKTMLCAGLNVLVVCEYI